MAGKKIILVCQTYYPAINPRSFRCRYLAEEFQRTGYDVTVFSAYDDSGSERVINGVRVIDYGPTNLLYENSFGKRRLPLVSIAFRRIISIILDVDNISIFRTIKRNKSLRFEIQNSNVILSITAPHGINWALAKILQGQKNKIWIADCGDPYIGNPFTPNIYKIQNKHRELEFIRKVSHITVPIIEAKEAFSLKDKITVIPQGFPPHSSNYKSDERDYVRFCYAGKIYPDKRPITPFLDRLRINGRNFEFHIYTPDTHCLPNWIKLDSRFLVFEPINREDIMQIYAEMDFLVYLTNDSKVQIGSKVIDYSLADVPILEVEALSGESAIEEFLIRDYKNAIRVNIEEYRIDRVAAKFKELFI